MLRRLIVITGLALALPFASLARAEHASGTLYTRVLDGVVRAAVAIQIHPDRHLYHTDPYGPQTKNAVATCLFGSPLPITSPARCSRTS